MWRPVLAFTALLAAAGLAPAEQAPAAAKTSTAPAAPAAPAARPSPPTLGPESLQSFDSQGADLRWQDGRWQLVAGGVLLKDFGRHETEGRQALRLLRELRLNQRGTLGSPQPVMEYWLADGHAPQGRLTGLHALPLDPASLRAEPIQGQWWVRDNARALFNFGGHADEARQAVAVLRHYGFTQLVALGGPGPEMLVFLGGAGGVSAPRPARAAAAFPTAHEPALRPAAFGPHAADGGVNRAAFTQAAGGADAGLPPDFVADAERVPLSWRDATVRHDEDGWKLVAGGTTLASFGTHDGDARLALEAVRHYHFTEHGALGRPPLFSYFLVNGQAPRGYMAGLQHTPFRPETLTLRQAGDEWGLYDGTRPLLAFGDHPDEARQALRLIRRYQFDTLCTVGHPDTGALTFFVRAH